jgi:hypothetical protein
MDGKKTRWFTSRKVITVVGFVTATVMVYTGKMTDSVWVYAMAVFIAGHHAADIVSAFRKQQ